MGIDWKSTAFKALLAKYRSYPKLPPIRSEHENIFFTREEWRDLGDGEDLHIGAVYFREINGIEQILLGSHDSIDRHKVFFRQNERDATRERIVRREKAGMWKKCDDMEQSRVRYSFDATRLDSNELHHKIWPMQDVDAEAIEPEYLLRHYYSATLMKGVRLRHRQDNDKDNMVFQDVNLRQIYYKVGPKCPYTWCNIEECRCVPCLPLHTARLPDVSKLEESQYVAVKCELEHNARHPVFRNGVTSEEHRPEFIVQPFNLSYTPMLAFDPKVYRISSVENGLLKSKSFSELQQRDLYAEFKGAENPSVRYVMATTCRYTRRSILRCICGICKELRESTDMSTYSVNVSDKFHYIWIRGYDLREPHVINSDSRHHREGVDAWRTRFSQRVAGAGGWRNMDINLPMRPTNDGYEIHDANITIHECTATVDPFSVQPGSNTVPGPFGRRKAIADSGATKHMFGNKNDFSTYEPTDKHFVRVANGTLQKVLGIGRVGPLEGVLHVPSLVHDLMSESELDAAGMWCITANGVKTYYDPSISGKPDQASIFMVARLDDSRLYVINPMYLNQENPRYDYFAFNASSSKAEAIDLLHKVLGHVNVDRIQQMISIGRVEWNHESNPVNLRRYSSPCVACALAKSKRQSHTGRIRVPLQPGSMFYVDVWGPCEVASLLNENVYTIGFIDAATKRA